MNNSIQLLDFDICEDIFILQQYQLVIWGAAEKGQSIKKSLQNMGLTVAVFCDSSAEKQGKICSGIKTISPYLLKKIFQKEKNICIISCVSKENEIISILQEYGESPICFVSYWGIKTASKLWKKEYLTDETGIFEYLLKHSFQNIAIKYLKNLYATDEKDIWILQPGKTASSTLELRFKIAGIPFVKQHTLHFPDYVLEEELKPIWENSVSKQIHRKHKIIAAVREPLTRDYSAFWQSFTNGLERAYLMPIFNHNIQQMYDDFTELILSGYRSAGEKIGCALPYTWRDEFVWFNEEIKQYFDIDVYAYPFDRQAGYQIIEHNKVQLFVFKLEKMDCIMSALCDFVGCSSLSVQNTNIAKDKIYHLAYKEFRKAVKVSSDYVNHYYKNNVYVNHFYTKEERTAFLKQWEKNIRDDNI